MADATNASPSAKWQLLAAAGTNILDGAVTTPKLADGAVTPAKVDSAGSFVMSALDVLNTLTRNGNTVWDDGNTPRSLMQNGYQQLPSGLIVQWGKHNAGNVSLSGPTSIVYPIPFPTAVFSVVGVLESATSSAVEALTVANVTTTGFDAYQRWVTSSCGPGLWDYGFFWVAMGY